SETSAELVNDAAPRPNEDWNYLIFVSQGIIAGSSKHIGNAKLLLPYLYTATGAPVYLAGLLLPIMSACRIIGQILTAPVVGAARTKRWFLFLGWITTAIGLAAAAFTAGISQHWLVMVIFLLVAIAMGITKGMNALAFNSLLGWNISKTRRNSGILFISAAAGVMTVAVTVVVHLWASGSSIMVHNTELAYAAAIVTAIAGVMILAFQEEPQDTAAELEAHERLQTVPRFLGEVVRGYHDLIESLQHSWMRRYILMRLLTTTVIIATPFYAVHGAVLHANKNAVGLSAFVISASVAVVICGPVWKWIGARSQRLVTSLGSAVVGCGGLWAIVIDLTPELQTVFAHSFVFALAAAGIQGVNGSRLLFLIEASPKQDLTYYVAITNTVSAVAALILATLFGMIAEIQGVIWPVVLVASLNFLAALQALALIKPKP
ncbi:MAG: MFS transporter, partial [Pseudomonadota bacterium]